MSAESSLSYDDLVARNAELTVGLEQALATVAELTGRLGKHLGDDQGAELALHPPHERSLGSGKIA